MKSISLRISEAIITNNITKDDIGNGKPSGYIDWDTDKYVYRDHADYNNMKTIKQYLESINRYTIDYILALWHTEFDEYKFKTFFGLNSTPEQYSRKHDHYTVRSQLELLNNIPCNWLDFIAYRIKHKYTNDFPE